MVGGEAGAGRNQGTIYGQPFAGKIPDGEADVRLLRENLFVDRLLVTGKGFELRASGELEKKVSFAARISDLSSLVPNTAGSVSAEGWLRRKGGRVSGAVKGRGRSLSVQGVKIASAAIDAGLSDGKGYPLNATVNMRGVHYSDMSADSANLKVGGNLERHTIDAEIRSPGFALATTLNGGYKEKVWQGEIARLSGRDAVGPWRLLAPASLRVSADSISLAVGNWRRPGGIPRNRR
jgi:translocation and assembly module TamB